MNSILEATLFRGLLLATFSCAWVFPLYAQAEPILVGFTSALSGPHAAYGQGLRHGVQLALDRANATSGAGGRQFELLVMDDAGDPDRAASNAKQLLQRGVVALTGVYGARATKAISAVMVAPGATAATAPLVGPATSAESLRSPPLPGVFHLRAGVTEEAAAAVLHLDTLGITRYALIVQEGSLGESGLETVTLELIKISIRPVNTEAVPRDATDADILRALAAACAKGPEAVILAVDARTAQIAINAGRTVRCAVQYLVFSETGAALAAPGVDPSVVASMAGVLVTQVVPHPNHLMHPLVAEYQTALSKQGVVGASYPSLEGYLSMRVVQEAIRGCSREDARGCLLNALRLKTFQLPGLTVHLGSSQRQMRPFVEITLLDRSGKFRR